jgi:hypothetical protein
MAAPDFTASRLGLVNATGGGTWAGDNALFLQVWAGEVLTAFRKATIFEPLHTVRTISSGKSASFPIVGLNSAAYHTPGTMLTGTAVKNAEAVIKVDDKLVSNVFIADIDEAKNHWDVRSPYSAEMGNALAYRFDQNIAAMIAKAARTATNFNTDLPGGTRIKIVATSKAAITGAQLATALFAAAQKMDENNLPEQDRYCVLAPAEYYKNDYSADFTTSVALAFNKQAVGTVKLMDLKMEQTGSDVHALWQGTFMVASMALGSNILRPDCAVEIYTATS